MNLYNFQVKFKYKYNDDTVFEKKCIVYAEDETAAVKIIKDHLKNEYVGCYLLCKNIAFYDD